MRLSAADVWADPDAVFTACIEVWHRQLADLAPEQRPAALVWHYTGQVNNGGHLQYFVNLPASVSGQR